MSFLQRSYLYGLGLLSLLALATPAAALCPAQLPTAIAAITQDPQFRRVRWGILVQSLEPALPQTLPQTLYAENSDQYFTPASNVKLLTTAAALEQLGPQFRFRTSVYQIGDRGTVLRIVGRGDPTLTETELRELADQIAVQIARQIAGQASRLGLTPIDLLILDDRHWSEDAINPTWEWEDIQAGYGAPVTSLILDENAIGLTLVPQNLEEPLRVVWDDPREAQQWQIDNRSRTVAPSTAEFLEVGRDLSRPVLRVSGQLRIGSEPEPVAISVPQPVVRFGDRFVQALATVGLQVNQVQMASDSLPDQAREIAVVESPPLSTLLIETNQESNNLYAEVMLRSLGSPPPSSLETGLSALETALTRLGVSPDSYELSDGSGLSRRNLVSPEALVTTLRQMARSPHAAIYRNSLSVAGTSGTLRNRFQDTIAVGIFQGKTGSITGAVALSGYLAPPEYPPVALSIMANSFESSPAQIRSAIDQIVEQVANLKRC